MSDEFAITQIKAGFCLSYLLVSDGEAVLVDPHITKIQAYRDRLTKEGLALKVVIDTHTHADHLSSAAIVAGEYGCPIVMSEKALSSLDVRQVGAGDAIEFGRARLEVMPAPGHTDDSIALIGDGCVFTGDLLLIGSVGRTDFQNGSPEDMFDTLGRIKQLPDATTVYPAHDYKDNTQSTVGREKQTNPFMIESDRDAFCATARAKVLAKPFNMDAIIKTNREGTAKEIEYVSPAEARERLDAAEGKWQVLDVRRPEEYRAVRIEPSRNIPLDTLAARLPEIVGADQKFIVSCATGARASVAAGVLMAAGAGQVTVLDGALKAWRKADLPVTREKVPVSLERQVRTIAGGLVLAGSLLALLVSPWFLIVPIVVSSGLVFAGLTGSCMMGMLLMKLPYNRKALQPGPPPGGTCSLDDAPDGGCSM